MREKQTVVSRTLERFSRRVTGWCGTSWAFGAAVGIVLLWLATGPVFGWSDTWQLVINTGTTIVTFLMVFLIQRSQNKEGRALQLKLDELIAAVEGASGRLLDVEDLSEQEIDTLHRYYREIAAHAKRDRTLQQSHSIEEAERRHRGKRRARARRRRAPPRETKTA